MDAAIIAVAVWVAGMVVAGFIAGQMAARQPADKQPASVAVLVFILTWPVQLVAAPVVGAFLIGKHITAVRAKRKAANAKPKR